MKIIRSWLLVGLALLVGSVAHAAEVGVATVVDSGVRVLRGPTWFKLVPGARLDDGDIVEAPERMQVHLEFAAGSAANLVGAGTIYIAPPAAKAGTPAGPLTVNLVQGWCKVAAKAPGVRVRMGPADIAIAEGVVVIRKQGMAIEFFVEAGNARLIEALASGADGPVRDAKRGDYGWKPPGAAFALEVRAPRIFVDAMPRHFYDALPQFAGKFKAKPTLVADRDISYAEAEPWLAGRDRAVFERRFASRLRDPVFRRAVEPNVARYPAWDRMLHPEKYAPKPVPQS